MAKKDSLSRAAEILGSIDRHKKEAEAQREQERRDMIFSIGQGVADSLKPVLNELASQSRLTRADMADFVSKIKVETHTPDVIIPNIEVPKAEVTVRSPKIRIPDVIMPDEMNVRGWVQLQGVDLNNPLPVQLRDASGNPLKLAEQITQIIGGGSGGSRYVKINNTASEPIPVSGTISSTFDVDFGEGEVASKTIRTVQAANSVSSVSVQTIFGSTITSLLNGDNRIPVSVETGGSGLTDAELRASSVPVAQASGANWSVYVTGATGSIAVTSLDGDGNYRSTFPVEGSVAVSGVTGSITSYLIDGDGNYRGTVPVQGTVAVSGITNTVGASIVDSSGVQYSGSNPVPVSGSVSVSGSLSSVVAVGDIVSDEADTGSAPVKVGGIARTANPTAVAGGDRVSASFDSVGRQLVKPLQVRGLLATAYTSVSNGTEASLLTGVSGEYHDLVWVTGANQSDAAVLIDFRASTGGTVIFSLEIPASSTAGIAPAIPYPQPFADATWTVDMDDITGTTVDITALFSKEV